MLLILVARAVQERETVLGYKMSDYKESNESDKINFLCTRIQEKFLITLYNNPVINKVYTVNKYGLYS